MRKVVCVCNGSSFSSATISPSNKTWPTSPSHPLGILPRACHCTAHVFHLLRLSISEQWHGRQARVFWNNYRDARAVHPLVGCVRTCTLQGVARARPPLPCRVGVWSFEVPAFEGPEDPRIVLFLCSSSGSASSKCLADVGVVSAAAVISVFKYPPFMFIARFP